MDKVYKIFDKDFEYFLEEKIVNTVEENKGQVIQHNTGTVNNFPKNFIEELKNLIRDNKDKDKVIQELREQLEKRKKQF